MCTAVAFKEVIGIKKWVSLQEEIVVDMVVDADIYGERGKNIQCLYVRT
jgi:hypothetical protein